MPYSGPADRTLPASVARMPRRVRAIWVEVFNANYDAADEGIAFRAAFAAARRALEANKMAEREQAAKAMTQTDGGHAYGASAFLFVPDPEKPSTWKLRIEELPGKVTVAQLGRAAAALSGKGFMGNPVQGLSDAERKSAAKRLIALYHGQDVADADIPEYLFGIAGEKPKAKEATLQDAGLLALHGEPVEKAGARHSAADHAKLAEIKGHASAIHQCVNDLGGSDEQDAEKAVSLSQWQQAVESALLETFPGLWCVQVTDEYAIAAESASAMPGDMQMGEQATELDAEAEPPDEHPMAGIPHYWKIPYTVEYQGAGDDAEIVVSVQFAARGDWLPVVPVFDELKAFDQADGRTRWLGISSGGFRDRDGEIVSSAFLASAVKAGDETGQRGTLDVWHIPGSDVGTCDFQALADGFLLESGLFDETPAGVHAASAVKALGQQAGMSIQFLYANKQDGVYDPPGVILRRSILPRTAAAFPWSGMALKEFSDMAVKIDEKKRQFLAEVVGEDETATILAGLERGAEALKANGVAFKELQPEAASEAAPAEAAQPEPATAEVKEAAPTETVTPVPEATAEADKETVSAQTETEFVLSDVAMQDIAALVEKSFGATVDSRLADMLAQLETMHAAVTKMSADYAAMTAEVAALKAADETKIAAIVRDLPRATIKQIQRPTQRPPEPATEAPVSLLEQGKKALYG